MTEPRDEASEHLPAFDPADTTQPAEGGRDEVIDGPEPDVGERPGPGGTDETGTDVG